MRRWVRAWALMLSASAMLAFAVAEATPVRDPRALWMFNVHTRETLRVRPFASATRLERATWRAVNRFMRSHRTGFRRTMHPRLVRVLARIQAHFGGRRIELVSAYRVAATDADVSYHSVGRAADIRIRGVPDRVLFEYCRTLPRTGCGLYPNGHHVHVDVRGESGLWVDLSPPGDGVADYVRDPWAWLRANP